MWWYACKSHKFPISLLSLTIKTIQIMAHTNYQIKREFTIGETIYIPEYGSELPLPDGTATKFTIVGINTGNTDRSTELIVTCPHGKETLKLAVIASKAYKIAPSRKCSHCGHEVCFEAEKELMREYEYYCPECDENLYGIEVEIH